MPSLLAHLLLPAANLHLCSVLNLCGRCVDHCTGCLVLCEPAPEQLLILTLRMLHLKPFNMELTLDVQVLAFVMMLTETSAQAMDSQHAQNMTRR